MAVAHAVSRESDTSTPRPGDCPAPRRDGGEIVRLYFEKQGRTTCPAGLRSAAV
jgi:hypothetical protein